MIKVNDRFSIDNDKYNWILLETYTGKDRDGNPKKHTKETFHANLGQIAQEIIDRGCKECDSLEQIMDLLADAATITEDTIARKL